MATRLVWITILSHANYLPKEWLFKSERITIQPGSLITSIAHLAELAGVSFKQARTAIKDLITLDSIRANQKANRFTEISVVNWDTYNGTTKDQGKPQGQQRANRGQTEGNDVRRKEGEKERRKNVELPLVPASGNGHDPKIKELVVYWYSECQRLRHFVPPQTWAKDGSIIKTMIRGRDDEEVRFCINEFLANPPMGFRREDAGRFSGKCNLQAVLLCMDQLLQRRKR